MWEYKVTYQLNLVDVDGTYQPLPEILMIDVVAQIPGSWATATKSTAHKLKTNVNNINVYKRDKLEMELRVLRVKLNRKQNYLCQLYLLSLNVKILCNSRMSMKRNKTHTHTHKYIPNILTNSRIEMQTFLR